MGRMKWGAVLLMAVAACATVALPPVGSDRFIAVELDGGTCSYQVTPLDFGACFFKENDHRPREFGQEVFVRCGETAMLCEQPVRCDCSKPKRIADCDPGRTAVFEEDGGIALVYPRQADGTPLPPLAPRHFTGRNEFGNCAISLNPPSIGYCNVGGYVPNGTGESMYMGPSVPFGESRELCGVRLTCRCEEFTERETAPVIP